MFTLNFTFEEKDKQPITLQAEAGDSILEIALKNDIELHHNCGGVCACSTCHDVVNSGNNSKGLMLDIGVTTAGGVAAVALNTAGLPQFTLTCVSGNQTGRRTVVTDPGAALITGKCADIGKTKVPALRDLAARGPYFHNGSAGNLRDVVNFYDRRFRLGLSPQEVTDLVNFLSTL